jgi:hypothetical protein
MVIDHIMEREDELRTFDGAEGLHRGKDDVRTQLCELITDEKTANRIVRRGFDELGVFWEKI